MRIFDHLQFRSRMRDALRGPVGMPDSAATGLAATPDGDATARAAMAREQLTLRKPRAISGRPASFEAYYVSNSQRERDRKLFSR